MTHSDGQEVYRAWNGFCPAHGRVFLWATALRRQANFYPLEYTDGSCPGTGRRDFQDRANIACALQRKGVLKKCVVGAGQGFERRVSLARALHKSANSPPWRRVWLSLLHTFVLESHSCKTAVTCVAFLKRGRYHAGRTQGHSCHQ